MLYIYTMECYWAIKNEIIPFAMAWVDLQGILLSEKVSGPTSQSAQSSIDSHLLHLQEKWLKHLPILFQQMLKELLMSSNTVP